MIFCCDFRECSQNSLDKHSYTTFAKRKNYFNLSSIQTSCLLTYLASFTNVFKIRCFNLALVP